MIVILDLTTVKPLDFLEVCEVNTEFCWSIKYIDFFLYNNGKTSY